MRLHFQAVTVHTERHADACLTIDIETALDDMDDLTVVGDGDRTGGIDSTRDIILVDHPT